MKRLSNIIQRSSLPILFSLLLTPPFFLTSCHRTCVCYGYDQLEHRYTEDEVNQKQNGNCANMVYQANTRYLSVCHWE